MFFFVNCTLRFDSKDCVPFRKMNLNFGGAAAWNTQRNCLEFLNEATEPLPPLFFRLLVGLTVNLIVPEYTLAADFASRLCFVMLTFGSMPSNT